MPDMTLDLTDMPRLTAHEDALLRRLCFFETGAGAALSAPMLVLKAELRARDQRRVVREPDVDLMRVPAYL